MMAPIGERSDVIPLPGGRTAPVKYSYPGSPGLTVRELSGIFRVVQEEKLANVSSVIVKDGEPETRPIMVHYRKDKNIPGVLCFNPVVGRPLS